MLERNLGQIDKGGFSPCYFWAARFPGQGHTISQENEILSHNFTGT